MEICVIDDGSSQIKLKRASDGTVIKIPSIVENRAVYSSEGVSSTTYRVEDKDYTVLTVSDQPERTDKGNYQLSDLNRVLVHEALRKGGLGGKDVVLGVTLPIEQYFERGESKPNKVRIEAKKANLMGPIENRAGEPIAHIREVYVFPEAIPAAIDVMTDIKDGQLVYKPEFHENKRVCVVDVGGHTIDIAVFESLTANVIQKEGFDGGVIRLVDSLQSKLMALLGESQPIERSIAEKAMINGHYAGHDLTATIRQIAAPLAEKVRQNLDRLASKRTTDLFICVGGGAQLVKEAVQDYAGTEKTLVPNAPDEAIARGVSKMLMSRLARNTTQETKTKAKKTEA
jgi:plasmid segregation protein ParM